MSRDRSAVAAQAVRQSLVSPVRVSVVHGSNATVEAPPPQIDLRPGWRIVGWIVCLPLLLAAAANIAWHGFVGGQVGEDRPAAPAASRTSGFPLDIKNLVDEAQRETMHPHGNAPAQASNHAGR